MEEVFIPHYNIMYEFIEADVNTGGLTNIYICIFYKVDSGQIPVEISESRSQRCYSMINRHYTASQIPKLSRLKAGTAAMTEF